MKNEPKFFSYRERQQQIEELLKELKRVSEEAETVKAALRGLKSKVQLSLFMLISLLIF